MRKEPYMKQMNRQQGFTLIELIVVIVILGILAVTAAPKFMNLTFRQMTITFAPVMSALAKNPTTLLVIQKGAPEDGFWLLKTATLYPIPTISAKMAAGWMAAMVTA